jgi:hypothetical protein
MTMKHGLATFPGIVAIVEGSIDVTVGGTPSVATLTIAPQANFVSIIGTLVFWDGDTRIEWPDAKVDSNSFERNAQGLIWRLSIYDRRWKWQATGGGGCISLGLNLRGEDNKLIKETELSPQQAADWCLRALGESNYDVSQLPNDDRPELIWDNALPSAALEELCDQFGCYVVLGLDNRVRICKVGEGAYLPETPDIMTNSLSLSISHIPKRIVIVCAPDRFQGDFLLEAVGIENDKLGTLKLIKDLSYMAYIDWEDECEYLANLKTRKLARQSLFRYYRVKFPLTFVPGYTDYHGNKNAQITYPWQVKFEDTQVETIAEDSGLPVAQRRKKPAQVGGIFWDEDDGGVTNSMAGTDVAPYQTNPLETDDDEEYVEASSNNPWRLGREGVMGLDHLVIFSKPMYMNAASTALQATGKLLMAPASLCLRTACTILEQRYYFPVRSSFTFDTGGDPNTLARFELFSDLQVEHYQQG